MHDIHRILDHIERRIDTHGLAAVADDLATVADHLVRTGTLPAIAGILVDPAASEAIRLRATGRAIRAIRSRPCPDRALVA